MRLRKWNGGDIPVPRGTRVVVQHRDGELWETNAGTGAATDWSHKERLLNGDIMAYAIKTNYKEENKNRDILLKPKYSSR